MIPTSLLRSLTLKVATYGADAYGAQAPTSWAESTILGRVDQLGRSESHAQGRQAEISEWLLLTNVDTIGARDRVVDGASEFEVVGPPWPVYAGSGVHHYEATLRLVGG